MKPQFCHFCDVCHRPMRATGRLCQRCRRAGHTTRRPFPRDMGALYAWIAAHPDGVRPCELRERANWKSLDAGPLLLRFEDAGLLLSEDDQARVYAWRPM